MRRFLAWLFGPRTCPSCGCGHQVQGNDAYCAICRLPMGDRP